MPELVEVEVIARNLRRWLQGSRIVRVDVFREKSVGPPGASVLREALVGVKGLMVHRRGKAILLEGQGPWGVLLRFGMSGKIVRESTPGAREGARIRLFLENESQGDATTLVYLDARNLGGMTPVDCLGSGGGDAVLKRAVPGNDAFTDPPDGAQVKALLGTSRSPVRVRLMDQSRISGIGNILVTEILFEAGIYPGTPSRDISPPQADAIATAIPKVIHRVLAQEDGEEIRYIGEKGATNPFPVYGRKGQGCPRCGESLLAESIGQRTSVFCPRCQPPFSHSDGQ